MMLHCRVLPGVKQAEMKHRVFFSVSPGSSLGYCPQSHSVDLLWASIPAMEKKKYSKLVNAV